MVAVAVLSLVLAACQSSSVTPSPSGGPNASAGPTGTLEPTSNPTAQPTASPWTGLDWSDGALGTHDESGRASITDLVPWGDGYVGAGAVTKGDGGYFSAFFTSPDGLHWAKTYQGADDWAGAQSPGERVPGQLLTVGTGLIAVSHTVVGAPSFWRSDDGAAWVPVDSPVPDVMPGSTLVAIAAGSNGLVAVGAEGSMCCGHPQGPAVITHSTDGLSWERVDLSAVFEGAYLLDVAAYSDGFVVVGRVGEQDDWGGGKGSGIGRPAAWTSADGVTWTAAKVEGAEAAGATLLQVMVGTGGLFATGRQADTSSIVGGQGPLSGWASADGRSWQLAGQLGTDLPDGTVFAGDAGHMLIFGRDSCKATALRAWASTNGRAWTDLAFSGSQAIPDIDAPICQDDGTEASNTGGMVVSYAVVLSDGVLVVGSGGLPQEFWFARATNA